MKNQIKVLDNGLVEMICKDTQDDKHIKVYFQEDVLEHVSTFDVEWKSWSGNRKNKVFKFIGTTYLKSDGKKRTSSWRKWLGTICMGKKNNFHC